MRGRGYERLLRVLLRLYSRGFRARLGEDLVHTALGRVESLVGRGRRVRGVVEGVRTALGMVWAGPLDRARSGDWGNIRSTGGLRGVAGVGLQARQVARRIRRSPGLTVGVVGAFVVGIGANATMYGMVDQLLLSPPPHLEAPGELRLVAVESYSEYLGRRNASPVRSYPELVDFEQAASLVGAAGYEFAVRELTVGRGRSARRLRTQAVTGGYFGLLGVRPVLGRLLQPADDEVGAENVIVLSEDTWRRDHGSDPALIGSTIDFGRGPHVVVGVAPAGFTGVELTPVDAWIPLAPYRAHGDPVWDVSRQRFWLRIVARLAPGATEEAAAAELTVLHRSAYADEVEAGRYPADAEVLLASVVPGQSPLRPMEVDVARWLAAISVILLLLASLNVANLLVARQLRDRRATEIQRALGASRARLAGGVALESAALACGGAAAAVVVAGVLGSRLRSLLLPNVAWRESSLLWEVAAVALGLGLLAAAVATILPSLTAAGGRADAVVARARGSGRDARRLRSALVAAQVGLSVVLLLGAGLFLRSFGSALDVDLGVDTERLYQMAIVTDDAPEGERQELFRRGIEALRSVGTVGSAGASATQVFFQRNGAPLRAEGVDSLPEPALVHAVAGDYFRTVGLTVRRGRPLGDRDGSGTARVAVVSSRMAESLWQGRALGRCLYIGRDGQECTEVVGIVEDVRVSGIGSEPPLQYYVSAAQQTPASGLYLFLVRFGVAPTAAAVAAARSALLDVDPRIRFVEATATADLLESQLRPWRLGAAIFSAFGAMALLLAALGLSSLVAFDVARRRRELGIRASLGAGRIRLLASVAGRAIPTVAAGTAAGGLAGLLLAPRLGDLLFQVDPRDPFTLLTIALVLIAVAVVASGIPALRAARVDPAEALKSEG